MPGGVRDRHLLDPRGGYRSPETDDDLRVEYRRVELGTWIVLLAALIEAGGNIFHRVLPLWVLIGVTIFGTCAFWTLARYAQRRPACRWPRLSERFVTFAVLCSSCAGWIAGIEGYVTTGYSLAILVGALFFMIPTPRFVGIGIATYAFFVCWNLSLDQPFFTHMYALSNTGLAVLAACFGRAGIERIRDVAQQQRVRIAEQNVALTRRNGELNDLMAIAAHDLRSPLLGLRSVLDLSRAHPPASAGEWDNLLGIARSSVSAMIALVSRLLDVHDAEGRQPPPIVSRDIGDILTTSVHRMSPLAQSADVRIETDITDDPSVARCDPESAGQVFDNLLSNAIRYSYGGSLVLARVTAGDNHVSVEIIDEGVGVPEDERPTLFEKFRRGETSPPDGSAGSGLGLYIASLFAENMSARCSYRPNPTGGSIFRVDFVPDTEMPEAG